MGLRSTVVAPSRERICMLSWVAMERIYEREVLPDAKLRKQAGARPLRVHAKHLTDGELLAKLCSFGIEMDRTWLDRECERALSAQEIAGPLMDQSESRGLESDWIWICVVTLWRRWLPDQPSFRSGVRAGPLGPGDRRSAHGPEREPRPGKRLDLDLRGDPVAALVARPAFLRGTG